MYLGIDFGTSGARAVVIDSDANILATAKYPFNARSQVSKPLPWLWQRGLFYLISRISLEIRGSVERIVINGTSATV